MSEAVAIQPTDSTHFDVLIVGAGISGVGSAWHMLQKCPGKSFAILEAQEGMGGTWRTHKYPGIRSDSDLYTFGYAFKPWRGVPVATADAILDYMQEVIDENGIDDYIRYGHMVKSASWSSEDQRWTLVAEVDGEQRAYTCNFLWMCQGYYRHWQGYTPEWEGMDNFKGQIVHPQTWPEDLDYKDKNVVVIGSGATAATIIPAMAGDTKHITMLQRSPTYFFAAENRNELYETLNELDLPPELVHDIVRKKVLHDQQVITERSFTEPEILKQELIAAAKMYLPEGYPVEKHFTPDYRPWQQRLAFVPEGDMFKGIAAGKASVVTDEIDRFVENGIRLKSGDVLEADIIVTATGFNLCMMGDIAFDVDGRAVEWSEQVTWRGCMFADIPNMLWVFGYLRASWTLRTDMLAELTCRLFKEMDARGAGVVTPRLRPEESNLPRLEWIDAENFNAGYLRRNMDLMPRQLGQAPWEMTQDYYRDKEELPQVDFGDGSLVFETAKKQASAA